MIRMRHEIFLFYFIFLFFCILFGLRMALAHPFPESTKCQGTTERRSPHFRFLFFFFYIYITDNLVSHVKLFDFFFFFNSLNRRRTRPGRSSVEKKKETNKPRENQITMRSNFKKSKLARKGKKKSVRDGLFL